MKAKVKVLYQESKSQGCINGGSVDEATVTLRRWIGDGETILVIDQVERVKQNDTFSTDLYPSYWSNAQAIRKAIKTFDALVAGHPVLGKEQANDQAP